MSLTYRPLTSADLPSLAQMYIDYWNGAEGGQWTQASAVKRLWGTVSREGSFGLVLEDAGRPVAFNVGWFQQFDDCVVYFLDEVLVAAERQNAGLGARFMEELERQVKARGAALIELQSVNDGHHAHFYGKLGYRNAQNLVVMSKVL